MTNRQSINITAFVLLTTMYSCGGDDEKTSTNPMTSNTGGASEDAEECTNTDELDALYERHIYSNEIGGEPMISGDFNNDGSDDILYLSDLSMFLSKGDGTFESEIKNQRVTLNATALADVNGDGNLDLLGIDYLLSEKRKVYVFFGDGKGGLTESPKSLNMDAVYQAESIAIEDIDQDGDKDLFIGQADSPECVGAFNKALPTAADCKEVQGRSVCDNGSKCLPISENSSTLKCLPPPCPNIAIYLNNGKGEFTFDHREFVIGSPDVLGGMDLTGDSKPDIVSYLSFTYSQLLDGGNKKEVVTVFVNQGGNTFKKVVSEDTPVYHYNGTYAKDWDHYMFYRGDIDKDGVMDLVCDRGVYFGVGDGSFTKSSLKGKYLLDANGDGNLDLAVSLKDKLGIFHGDGTRPKEGADMTWLCVERTGNMTVGKFNNDSKTDIALGEEVLIRK
jgi:hypothetical protein